ncbi:hypothetical protein DUNSADRAFT_8264 [Dunaliella salina]|uniref:Uncharacterized protein n=1 Tax=Dunaliella salina TaxID=3046 RepID=A0ABQ7HA66_DUNSA|nr:hypothetical protein DUNSADRAFT_8264 [Dunaliella salina]|eukprot:KAF5843748.1 hypothetical protein DUNSADRAFT_8264 [Dunaliella salina]
MHHATFFHSCTDCPSLCTHQVHQKYNAVMTELQSLHNEADKAAKCGLAAESSKCCRLSPTAHFLCAWQVHQKYNAVMTELQSLRNEADKAAKCGLAAEFSKWRRMLWAQGARKYCQLRTWQRVSGVLHKDLLGLREVARAYVLSQRS